uniref:Uncharacterized protein n=1 Tax=Oryza barthii TaxID=65489 RepID=A0A0D3GD47_9ORYZ
MDEREAMARSLLAKLSHSPRPGWILERVERTRRLLAKAEAVYETLLGFVDSGCSPFTVDELNGIICEVDLVTYTVICPSVQQIDTDLAALLASPPPVVVVDASVPQGQLMIIISFAKSLQAKLSDSPSGSLLLRCNLLHLATTRQLIASLRAIYDTLEEFVDAGFIPLHSDDFLEMIRDIRDAGETLAAD